MTEEELKNKCTERAKIFQQAMESCKSSSPIDCIEWFADRIIDLEKENSNVKEALEGYKKIAKWCDKCDKIAELKLENQKWKDEWQEQVQKATDEGYARTLQTIQLTKAKEHIENLLYYVKQCTCERSNYAEIEKDITEAEQFISEVEK